MADIFSKSKRSEVMSRIRGSGNKETELALAKIFRKHGVTGWRRNQPLFGKPDFTFRRQRSVVFVDGCFWHGCPKHSTMPASNRAFWMRKLTANKARDLLVTKTLRREGWRVIRVWEHELAGKDFLKSKLRKILDSLKSKVKSN
ncbi:MAG: very short patch repair endonuclease [Burkholderiales bacterium]|nr:very short patch repair endonuclease [Burkholderiales bacterium]